MSPILDKALQYHYEMVSQYLCTGYFQQHNEVKTLEYP